MRCERFRGLSAGFACCSGLVVVQVHWIAGRTIVCPRSVEKDCQFCRGMVAKQLGYAAVRLVNAHGFPGELTVAELPPSLSSLVALSPVPQGIPYQYDAAALGCYLHVERESVRSAWRCTSRKAVSISRPIALPDVLDSIGRLFRLPVAAEAPVDSFAGRYGDAVVAHHDSVLMPHTVG